jgi:hypothetical protein
MSQWHPVKQKLMHVNVRTYVCDTVLPAIILDLWKPSYGMMLRVDVVGGGWSYFFSILGLWRRNDLLCPEVVVP